MADSAAEIVIVGAGPSGCAAATYLARLGHDVLLVDRHSPARTVIGESLIPAATEVLVDLGVPMDGFLRKHGAVFTWGDDERRFGFDEGLRRTFDHAWQTPRAALDERMRAVARDAGARFEVRDVRQVEPDAGLLHSTTGTLRGELVVDAGGRDQLFARALGIRRRHPTLRNAAVGAWYRGICPQPAERTGDVVIACYDGGWFWFIPFADGTWSVGTTTTPNGPSGPERFAAAVERCPAAQRRLQGATRIEPLRGASDISVTATAFHGPRWALLGDAATFLDPIFSTGVAFGLHAARALAAAVHTGEPLDGWERRCRDAVAAFEPVVAAFYAGDFVDVTFAPPAQQRAEVRAALISLLAGDVFDPGFRTPARIGARLPQLATRLRAPAAVSP